MSNGYVMSASDMGFDFVYADENENDRGWVCPKCGRSISPQYKTCPYCSTQAADEGLAPGEQMICDAR